MFYAVGVECRTFAGTDWHSGLLLRMVNGGGADFYTWVGTVWSSDRFWYAVRASKLSLI